MAKKKKKGGGTPKTRGRDSLKARKSMGGGQTQAVDLVTGKAKVEYFFDPNLAITEAAADATKTPAKTPMKVKNNLSGAFEAEVNEILYSSRQLFFPCTIIKTLDDEKKEDTDAVPVLVKTSDGTLHKISDSAKLVQLTSPEDYQGLPDVLHLPHVTEASLLHALRIRYNRDDIYTSAGPILVSVNPYKEITVKGKSLYSEDQMMTYRNASSSSTPSHAEDKLPPHLFKVADRAYSALIASGAPEIEPHIEEEDAVLSMSPHPKGRRVRDQSIIISGESGAGKTEATKIIMKYLARITKKAVIGETPSTAKSASIDVASLEDRVLSSNPLLESFGNARTLRNDNSSRFGKFIEISFNTTSGVIIGASISNYLLEKTRITTQIEGERNYHIFYQLLTGADEALLDELDLTAGVAAFRYLGNRPAQKSRRDVNGFEETKDCLSQIGLNDDDQKLILSFVAATLHLGNIEFEETGDADGEGAGESENARITDASLPSLKKACTLLGLNEDEVKEAILTKLLSVGGKTIHKPQNVAQAQDKRDALAKMAYSSLFLWLVGRINATIAPSLDGRDRFDSVGVDEFSPGLRGPKKSDAVTELNTGFIGVLDIYGFEQFDTNGFEQLLINYANEKLQRHFNRHLFEVEQELYTSEGVDWSYITFNDNRPCLELIEGGSGSVGLLNTLDDAWGGMGSASEKDVKFVSHLHQQFGGLASPSRKKTNNGGSHANKHKNFITPKFGNDRQFIIVHYAGEVRYTANGFVEKNVESLSNELKDLGSHSSLDLAKEIFAASAEAEGSASPIDLTTTPGRRSTIRGKSVATQFRTSLQKLVVDLELTQPHYIRCIKPNLDKSSGSFNSGEVLRQLRYAGMMETIRIRREGYALREDHESFYNRFHLLLNPEEAAEGEGISHLVKVLSERLRITDADWQIGHTKIFLRRELANKLELLALLRVHAAARTLGRFGRFIAQRRASTLLTAWGRLRLHMLRIHRERRAATTIQAAFLMVKQREQYKAMQFSAIKMQSLQRRSAAIKLVETMRDPYSDMTFAELKALYEEEAGRLDEAAESNDFKTAADIEAKITPLKEAMEAKRPLTRTLLESMIREAQTKLDDALGRKAYDECGPLQKKVNELSKKRADLPTMSELKEAVLKAEKDVADAAARRDFSAAASGQAAIDAAKMRLEATLEAEGLSPDDFVEEDEEQKEECEETTPYASRGDLEADISSLQKEVAEAISFKKFKDASELQRKVDELELLREKYPTVAEIEVRLSSMKVNMDSAIQSKDFAKAEAIHGDIDVLKEKLKIEKERSADVPDEAGVCSGCNQIASAVDENGENIQFTSRSELEKKISELSADLGKMIAAKDFKKATATQRFVDQLESLRPLLPTVSEMKKTLMERKKEMNSAISKKDFAKAGEIQETIDVLEKEVKQEEDKEKENAKPAGTLPRMNVAAPRAMGLSSNNSVKSAPVFSVNKQRSMIPPNVDHSRDVKQVCKLRPKKPLLVNISESVLSVCQALSIKRLDAAIIPGINGGVSGIITDTDITRRVVAKHLDPDSTGVSDVMTSNPTCVSMSDSAMDALATMVENHFRHLPVVDDTGAAVGLLDIAKCLNDAISKLEKAQDKSSSAAEDAVKQVANLQGADGAQAEMLTQLLGGLVSQAFGGKSSPTLRSLLAGKPATVVSPTTNLRDAGMVMAEARKAALVVDEGELVGIFGFKDMMSRAIAKELPLELTAVSTVMTPNPESVSPDTTVLEALQIMHDNKFLTLPVCEDDGSVIGLVGVMDLVYGSGGADGWRSIFDSAMDLADDGSEVSSMNSYGTSLSTKRQLPKNDGKISLSAVAEGKDERPVSKLRPKKPMIAAVDDSVLSVTQMLASKRGDAALVTGLNGGLAGIITDTDVTRRVVAKHLDPAATGVSEVMTSNPTCVSMSDSAMDALATMVENHFRHLPVVDDSGAVVGLLDIAKCLNDAISKLEKAQDKSSSAAEDAVKQMASLQGAGNAQSEMLTQLLGGLVSQAFGGKSSPTLRSLLAGKPATIVSPRTNLRDAGIAMAEARKAALVVDEGELVGIFGFKDMMSRAIAKELPLELTAVSTVMTPNPESVSPDTTVLEALQIMHDNKFLTLPVCEDDGSVIGLVGVMDLVYGSGGADGWRSIFDSAMDLADDGSDSASLQSARSTSRSVKSVRSSTKAAATKKDERPVSKLRPKKPMIAAVDDSVLSVTQMLASKRGDAALVTGLYGGLAGIITDTDVTRRVVAKHLDPAATGVSEVMTSNPTCVSMSDSAMDALATMVENHFRHLPVVDDSGAVVGLLDIAKCLNDAISKLEKAQDKSSSAAEDAVKQMASLQGAGNAQSEMLTQLLGGLVSQAFGGKSSPTLRSLLAGKPATIVSPRTNLRDAGIAMAEARKAALVVDEGELVGIFGFKDMMSRAIAKELPLELTAVSTVMTPNPESVSPDTTVLEALQIMHDNKFLTLPVCEDDGSVIGLVGVMDLVYGSGGADGWRSIFDSAMDLADDGSDSASLQSARSTSRSVKSVRSSTKAAATKKDERPVSKLRPKKPMIAAVDDSVLSVTQMLASKRGDAALVTGLYGGLAGIITDTDVTRRVVAKHLDPAATGVSEVMTSNPTCVSMSDSAMDALATMVENHFRHLPVVDDSGAVVGLLDIAKCLNDAISKLEKAQDKSSSAAEDAVKQMASLQGAGNAQSEMLTQLLGGLVSQAFGGKSSPTLRSLLAGKPATIVSPRTNLRDAGIAMAEARKAALVVDEGELVGIFGFKDMMSRAIAKELPLELTAVSTVMTPNPESVSPDTTVLEALQIMHDNKFLTLPVCEDDGSVIGLVGVMDLVYGSGGADGWRSIFDSAMDLADDGSDSASLQSARSTSRSVKSVRSSTKAAATKKDERPVSKLRPKKPMIAAVDDSVLSVTQMLASKRGDAALITGVSGGVSGIITDTDVTRRVVAKHLDPAATGVSEVMTSNPTCVSMSDSAMDALATMVENHFRHLPVVDDSGAVVGLLDIAKCLNDAISKLEKAQDKSSSAAEDAVKQMASLQGAGNAQSEMLTQLLGGLVSQAFGGKSSPTLRSLLAGKPATVVSPGTNVRDAGMVMAEARKAALIVDDGELVGIFGFKDMMSRAIAKELPLELTAVSTVMTPNPESVSPDTTVLEALQIMHDNKFLTLPVCEDDGTVVGLVGVMDLVYGSGGADGWRSIFDSAMDLADDASDRQSAVSVGSQSLSKKGIEPAIRVVASTPFAVRSKNIPLNVEVPDMHSERDSIGESTIQELNGLPAKNMHDTLSLLETPMGSIANSSSVIDQSHTVFKIVDSDGNKYRVRCENKFDKLIGKLRDSIGGGIDASGLSLKFIDDEGDAVNVSSTDCLGEAIENSRRAGHAAVKLSLAVDRSKLLSGAPDRTLLMAGAGVAAALAVGLAIALKSK